MNEAFTLNDFTERFQFQIRPHRHASRLTGLFGSEILSRGSKAIYEKRFNPHARLREAGLFVVTPIGLFHVFAKGKLDSCRSILDEQVIGQGTMAQFNDGILAADGVGRAVQKIGRGQSAGELPVDIFRFGINHVGNSHHRTGGEGAFIHATDDHAVAVTIDQPRRHVPAFRVNNDPVKGNSGNSPATLSPNTDNFAIGNDDRAILNYTGFSAGPNGGVGNDNIFMRPENTAIITGHFSRARLVFRRSFLGHRFGRAIHRIMPALNPHFSNRVGRIKPAVTRNNGQIGQSTGFHRAQIRSAQQTRRHGRQRRQRCFFL